MIDSSPSPAPRRAAVGTAVLLAAMLALAVLANTVHIRDRFFWLDECGTYLVARLPPADMFPFLREMHAQPPLFYWLAHAALPFGDTPLALRCLSLFFMIGTLAFVLLGLSELALSSRIVLGLLLTLGPHALFVWQEYRPYAMASFFILVSSVGLARAIAGGDRWRPAALYGLSALGLQYSLTLNAWVYGCQAAAVGVALALRAQRAGVRAAVRSLRALLAVTLVLCAGYAVYLGWAAAGRPRWEPIAHAAFWTQVIGNARREVFRNILWSGPLWGPIALLLLAAGVVAGLRRRPGVTAYLLAVASGQLLVSTYLTYAKISWFSARYLTACFVGFPLLGALGFEWLVARRGCGRAGLAVALGLLAVAFPGALQRFHRAAAEPALVNPWVRAVEDAVPEGPVLIGCSPAYVASIPEYAFRHSARITVAWRMQDGRVDPVPAMRAGLRAPQTVLYFVWERPGGAAPPGPDPILPLLLNAPARRCDVLDLWQAYPASAATSHFPRWLYVSRPLTSGS